MATPWQTQTQPQQMEMQVRQHQTNAFPVQTDPNVQVIHVVQQPAPQTVQVVHVVSPQAPQPPLNQATAPCFLCCIIANAVLFCLLATVCIWALSQGVYIDDLSDSDSTTKEGLERMYIIFLCVAGVFTILFIIYAKSKNVMDGGFWCFGSFSMMSNIIGLVIGLFCCLCTCFSADSMIWVARTNNIELVNDAVVHFMPLRDIETGDFVLTMDPWTNAVFWDKVMLRIHYSWYDNANDLYSMRRLHLENNVSSITLSDDHFIFINDAANKPKVLQSAAVNIGDMVYYYDYDTKAESLQKVTEIEENVMTQKRVFFTMSPYVLVDNVVASPYIGPHPIYHTILHKGYSFGMRFISTHTYIWSIFSVFGYFIIYGSYYIALHWFECVVIVITAFYLFSVVFGKKVNTKNKKI